VKRQEQKRRLRIAQETLRTLSAPELGAAGGGARYSNYCAELGTQPKSTAWTGDYTDLGCPI